MTRFHLRPRMAVAAVLVLALAACGGGGEDGPAFALRDSAGVQIAESTRPAWAAGEEWTVGAQPLADIAIGRDSAFHAVRLADGRIAVARGLDAGLALYEAQGRRTDSTAAPVPWPEGVTWAGTGVGDSLLLWQPRRVLVFTPGGRFAREARPAVRLDYVDPRMIGQLADGSLLVTTGHHFEEGAPRRTLVGYLRMDPDGAPLGRFADLPDVARTMVNGTAHEVPFSPRTLVALAGGDVLVGDNRAFEFEVHAPDGTVRRIVRRAYEPMAVEPADVEAYHLALDQDLSDLSAQARAIITPMQQSRRTVPPADTFPAYTRLLAGAEGNAWAEEARRPHDYWPRWSVFAPSGRWLGTVKMPTGFALRQVGADWVMGTEPDVRGVLHVRVYPLVRPRAAGTPAP